MRLQAFLLHTYLHDPTLNCYINTKHCAGPQTLPQPSHNRWHGWITWKISLYCFQSYTIYNVGRIFPTPAKVAHISSGWVFKGSQEITPAAEGFQDMRSKIPSCLENASHCTLTRYIYFSNVANNMARPPDLVFLKLFPLSPAYFLQLH